MCLRNIWGGCRSIVFSHFGRNLVFIYANLAAFINFFITIFPEKNLFSISDWRVESAEFAVFVFCFFCLFVFYGISTFIGHLMSNPFSYK